LANRMRRHADVLVRSCITCVLNASFNKFESLRGVVLVGLRCDKRG